MRRGIFLPKKMRQIFTKLLEKNCIFIGTGHTLRIAKAISRCFNPKNDAEHECMSVTAALTMPGYFDRPLKTLYQYLVSCCDVRISEDDYLKQFKLAMEAYNSACKPDANTGRMDSFHYGTWRGMTVIVNGTNRSEIQTRLNITPEVYARDFKFITMGSLPVSFDILNVILKNPYQVYQIFIDGSAEPIDLSIDRTLIDKYFKGVKL